MHLLVLLFLSVCVSLSLSLSIFLSVGGYELHPCEWRGSDWMQRASKLCFSPRQIHIAHIVASGIRIHSQYSFQIKERGRAEESEWRSRTKKNTYTPTRKHIERERVSWKESKVCHFYYHKAITTSCWKSKGERGGKPNVRVSSYQTMEKLLEYIRTPSHFLAKRNEYMYPSPSPSTHPPAIQYTFLSGNLTPETQKPLSNYQNRNAKLQLCTK